MTLYFFTNRKKKDYDTHTCESYIIRADLGVIRISLKQLSFVGDQKDSGQVPCIKMLLHIMSIYDGCISERVSFFMQVNLTPGEKIATDSDLTTNMAN